MPLKADYVKHGDRRSYVGHAAFRTTLQQITGDFLDYGPQRLQILPTKVGLQGVDV